MEMEIVTTLPAEVATSLRASRKLREQAREQVAVVRAERAAQGLADLSPADARYLVHLIAN
jgi:hypothetical protein